MNRVVVIGDDIDAVKEHGLDSILPGPEREWIIAQRPEVRVQYKYRPTAL